METKVADSPENVKSKMSCDSAENPFAAVLYHFDIFSDEKKPSLQEIASERSITQRATGWKIHHVAAQLDELVIKLTFSFFVQIRENLNLILPLEFFVNVSVSQRFTPVYKVITKTVISEISIEIVQNMNNCPFWTLVYPP